MRSGSIAAEGDVSFVSIGTDDLTQLTYGFSKHDSAKYLVSIVL
jgi:phosphoenolpyruvate synthase/pyruvate phosphate dikinase